MTDGWVWSHSVSSSLDMIALVCTSSAPNGSSISRIDGSLISAAASATRLRMPPESWCGWWSSNPARPTMRSQSRASVSAVFFGTPRNSGPIATLPSTVFHGSSASVWNMKLVPRPMPVTGCPPTAPSPSLAWSRPATRVSVVDLPHPDGPTTAQNSPGSTVMVTSRRAVKRRRLACWNRLVTADSSMR